RVRVEDPLDAELDVVGREGVAAVELDVLPQVEDVGGGVRGLPPDREGRLQQPLRRVADQLLVDVVLEGVGGRPVVEVRVPAGRVAEERDLERAAGLRRAGGGGRRGEEEQEREQRNGEAADGGHAVSSRWRRRGGGS